MRFLDEAFDNEVILEESEGSGELMSTKKSRQPAGNNVTRRPPFTSQTSPAVWESKSNNHLA
jgi:hypothetical protein